MVTILDKSERGKILRGFHTHTWNSSNIAPETATKTFWQVETNMKKFNFIELLKMKYFFGDISLVELRCLFDAPRVLQDDLYVELLLAKQQVPMELLVERLNTIRQLLDLRPWNYNLLYSVLGSTNYRMLELRQAIRKATKFSGYVRNSSAVGSKNTKKIFQPEPEIFEWTMPVRIDYLLYLTVGEFTSGQPGSTIFTLKRTESPKRKSLGEK
jgi:hypothetical protein